MCSFFFFKQKTAYEMRISDWSSDVCSSDLHQLVGTVDRWAQRQRYEEAVDEQPLLVHPREVSGIEIPREAGPEIAAGILLNPSADEVRPDRQAIVMQVAQHPIELRVPVIQIAHVSRLERDRKSTRLNSSH